MRLVWAGLALAGWALAQEKPAEFEVASIKPASPPLGGQQGPGGQRIGCDGGPGTKDPGLFHCNMGNLTFLILQAYQLQRYQVSGPDWMLNAWFDISAKVPKDATAEQFQAMLQNLLTDRFKIKAHREKKDMAVYDLVVMKGGPKFQESVERPMSENRPDQPAVTDEKAPPQFDKDGFFISPRPRPQRMGAIEVGRTGKNRIHGESETMQELAQRLSALLQTPVGDSTGLKGKYDYSLVFEMSMPGRGNGGTASAPSTPLGGAGDFDRGMPIENLVQSELGLKLVKKKGPMEILVIDHVEKLPGEN